MEAQRKVLYIEDNLENRILVRRLLQSAGYDIIEAPNAKHALNILSLEDPDLILMDINMPDTDGYTLTAEIKKDPRFNNTPIVAITANVMKGDREKTLNAGCAGYIEKPIDVDTFLDLVSEYLAR
mgnify:CR=1 FL=1